MKVLSVLLTSLSLVTMCASQHTARVTIEAKDPTGGVFWRADVSVIAKSKERTVNKVTRTESNGTVTLDLEPGTYDLTYRLKGFGAVTRNVVVTAANTQTIAFTVQVGSCPPGPCIEVETVHQSAIPDYCTELGRVSPNLHVSGATRLTGRIFDGMGAPIRHSRIEVRRYVSGPGQKPIRTVKTNAEGRFNLDTVSEGEYRLIASPTRAFYQPDEMWCSSGTACFLDMTLQPNPNKSRDSLCPIK
jgi:5-hydroxyisourate hydrolase-like protein (transthyretin family)